MNIKKILTEAADSGKPLLTCVVGREDLAAAVAHIEETERAGSMLVVEVSRLQSELKHWKGNHADIVQRLALFTQRNDLPVDRIPAYTAMAGLQQERNSLKERVAMLININDNLEHDYSGAAKLVAEMHAAAVGSVRGPIRGVVEDVTDVALDAARYRLSLVPVLADDSATLNAPANT